MNPIIEALLLQIATLCLRITAKGQVMANCDLTGHTTSVYVTIFRGDTDFTTHAGIRAGTVVSTDVPYALTSYDWIPPAAQQARCEQELKRVIDQLLPYLPPEQQGAAA